MFLSGGGARRGEGRGGVTQVREAALQVLSALEAGKPPVYHNSFTVEESEKSAERRNRDCELWFIRDPEDGGDGAGGSPCSPYRLHDEAHNDGQTHTAAHHSDDDGRDFTCTGGQLRGLAWRRKPARGSPLKISAMHCRLGLWVCFAVMCRLWCGVMVLVHSLTRGELLPRVCNKMRNQKLMRNI